MKQRISKRALVASVTLATVATLAFGAGDAAAVVGDLANTAIETNQFQYAEVSSKAASARVNQIDSMTVEELRDGTTTLRLKGSESATFNVYRLSDPDRVVIDIASSRPRKVVPQARVDNWTVGRVSIDPVSSGSSELSRMMIHLKRDASYIILPNGDDLVVTITPRDTPPETYFRKRSAVKRRAELAEQQQQAHASVKTANAKARQAEARARAAEAKVKETEALVRKAQAELERKQAKSKRLARAAKKDDTKRSRNAARDASANEAAARRNTVAAQRNATAQAKIRAEAQRNVAEYAKIRAGAQRNITEHAKLKAGAKRNATEHAKIRAEAQRNAAEHSKIRTQAQRNANEQALVKAEAQRNEAEQARVRAEAQRIVKLGHQYARKERDVTARSKRNDAAAQKLAQDRKRLDGANRRNKNTSEENASARTKLNAESRRIQRERKSIDDARAKYKSDQGRLASQARANDEAARRLASAAVANEQNSKKNAKVASKQALRERELEAKEQELRRMQASAAAAKRDADVAKAQLAAEQRRALAQNKLASDHVSQLLKRAKDMEAAAHADRAAAENSRASAAKELATARGARRKASAAQKVALEVKENEASSAAESAKSRRQKASELARQLKSERSKVEVLLAKQAKESTRIARELDRKRAELVRVNEQIADSRSAASAKKKRSRIEGAIATKQKRLDVMQDELVSAQSRLDGVVARADESTSFGVDNSALAQVRDVRFEDSPDESKVIVSLDRPVKYSQDAISASIRVLRLRGVRLPEGLERTLDTSAYRSPIERVTSIDDGGDVKLIVATRGGASDDMRILAEGNDLVWVFPRKGSKGKGNVVSIAGSKVGAFAAQSGSDSKQSRVVSRRQKWHGERIDIELQDTPIKDVLLLFSDLGNVNIIAGTGVKGNVTMRLKAVPWDQALDIILRALSLGMVQEGNVIRVASVSALEEERKKAIERANAQVRLKPLETRLIPLSYATVGEMTAKVQSVLSSRGTVTPDTRTNTLIVMDVAENIVLAEQLVNQLDGQTPQVVIEARIVEARTSWLRQLGIQWGFDYIASAGTGNPTGLLFPNSLGVGGGSGGQSNTPGLLLPASAANPNYAVDLPAPAGTGAGGAIGFSFGSIAGNLNTNLRLSAAEDVGEVRIISAPRILAMDNVQAAIEQGVQIPVSQVSAQGVNTRYVNATLALRVTPHVTNEGSVVLEVQVQKNEADFINTGARGDPTILTKQATSRMLISDGDTAVIGGINTRNTSINRKKVPWLADIPVIGIFFKNRSEADTRTEVLIFLTPKIVNRSTSIGG